MFPNLRSVALVVLTLLPCSAGAADPADVVALTVHPAKIALKGRDDARQLIVAATLANGREQDLTGDATYEVADKSMVRVTPSGRVIPLANGTTKIVARHGERSATVPVVVEAVTEDLPINFGNQIVPIFTKLGCNAGNCHGKASGQNGFRLSLLGFEPEVDFAALVKEARGRRVFPAAPEQSLVLLKPTGRLPHAGGRRLDPDSDEYKLLRRWVAAGVPFGRPDDPVVTRISVYPTARVLAPQGRQQLAFLAHYSDGTEVDITRRAQYQSNDAEIAEVDSAGVVRVLGSGEVAIMARYQGMVAVFRATVPSGVKSPDWSFAEKTVVDKHTAKKWKELNLAPSELCSDAEFLRRASLDITGTLPTPKQVLEFVADKNTAKRDKLVDKLLDTPEHAYFFANKWANILKVRTGGIAKGTIYSRQGTAAFHKWIVDATAADVPYDKFVRAIVAATGDERTHPPAQWYKNRAEYPRAVGLKSEFAVERPAQFVDEVGQLFLGQRLACAQCHHHPYEKWSQDDYWGLAAYFGRFGRKYIEGPGIPPIVVSRVRQVNPQEIFVLPTGDVVNPRTRRPAFMKPLDGGPVDVAAGQDPREKLVDWMVEARNPYFARAIANRYWAHFLGRGLVEPIDDMRETNPPTNPELLDALAKELVDHKYSLKHLIRTICKSRTYQLSSNPNEFNKQDKQTYARYYPRRVIAEVLYDGLCQVTDSPASFPGLPPHQQRAVMLPDESYSLYFLDVFGRPDRISACECERSSEATLAQVLHLLNSNEVQDKISRVGGRADQLARDPRPDADKLDELFLWLYGRKPSPAQMKLALADIADNAPNKKAAYENILWALINTKEFYFNH